mmetsp:Transcript_38001/g.119292  ORF Transcript_38001/g.119292 Transcript_38001/m.119292 type:complete len:273 (-) Transcript_38001:1814-2632(-)
MRRSFTRALRWRRRRRNAGLLFSAAINKSVAVFQWRTASSSDDLDLVDLFRDGVAPGDRIPLASALSLARSPRTKGSLSCTVARRRSNSSLDGDAFFFFFCGVLKSALPPCAAMTAPQYPPASWQYGQRSWPCSGTSNSGSKLTCTLRSGMAASAAAASGSVAGASAAISLLSPRRIDENNAPATVLRPQSCTEKLCSAMSVQLVRHSSRKSTQRSRRCHQMQLSRSIRPDAPFALGRCGATTSGREVQKPRKSSGPRQTRCTSRRHPGCAA